MAKEYAHAPEDILWRRTKLGLHLNEAGVTALQNHMARKMAR